MFYKAKHLVIGQLISRVNFKGNLDCIKKNALELSTKWNIEPSFPRKKLHRVKKFFDEL